MASSSPKPPSRSTSCTGGGVAFAGAVGGVEECMAVREGLDDELGFGREDEAVGRELVSYSPASYSSKPPRRESSLKDEPPPPPEPDPE